MTKDEVEQIDRVVRVGRRNAWLMGLTAGLLVALIALSVVRLLDQPERFVTVCLSTPQGVRCP